MNAGGPGAAIAPRNLVQLGLCTLIWGSTWLVIRTQLGVVPVAWSVTYRFMAASVVMLAFCLVTRRSLALGRKGPPSRWRRRSCSSWRTTTSSTTPSDM